MGGGGGRGVVTHQIVGGAGGCNTPDSGGGGPGGRGVVTHRNVIIGTCEWKKLKFQY